MTLILKQSTSIDIRIGPFVDVGDAFTPETGITLAAADQAEVLKANGAATVAMAGAFVAVTGADGWYDYTVAAGDVDTVGEVVFVVQDLSVCLPVYVRGYVVEEAVYDAMYGAASAGPLQSTTAGRTLDVSATGEAGLDWANIGSPTTAQNLSGTNIDVDQVVASVSGAVGSVTGAVASVTAAVTISAGSVDAIWDETMTAHVTADSAAVALKDTLADVTGLNGDAMRGTDSALLAASAPANFGDMAITVTTGLVDITQAAADKAWATATRVLTAGTNLNDVSTAEVLTQVNAALDTAISELSQAQPTATPTLRTGMMLLYMALRNRLDVQTSGVDALEIRNAAGTVIAKKLLTDDGSDYSEALMVSGP